eukprot:GGOE01053715.1.p1 GENE.GGOE01053715.1~~GGOE01053715.1.p1  ORF type:complete len:123 (+),score=4.06 GGOE01053715.1:301-669(+)
MHLFGSPRNMYWRRRARRTRCKSRLPFTVLAVFPLPFRGARRRSEQRRDSGDFGHPTPLLHNGDAEGSLFCCHLLLPQLTLPLLQEGLQLHHGGIALRRSAGSTKAQRNQRSLRLLHPLRQL